MAEAGESEWGNTLQVLSLLAQRQSVSQAACLSRTCPFLPWVLAVGGGAGGRDGIFLLLGQKCFYKVLFSGLGLERPLGAI